MQGRDLLRELQRTVDELAALNEIGKALTSTLDLKEVLNLILDKVSMLLKPRNWSLWLMDEATKELVPEMVVGEGGEKIREMRVKPGEGVAGWVAEHGEAVLIPDVSKDPRFSDRFDKASQFQTVSILAAPLLWRGRTLGVVELVNTQGEGTFAPEDLRTLATMAEFGAIALENARNYKKVEELTVIDEHTGLFNARHLRNVLKREIDRARRFGHPVAVIFLDLDHFKQVNDVHGHQNGSLLLREVGHLVSSNLRTVDVPVRYGGDEFVVLLPETSKDQAMSIAERLRRSLDNHAFLAEQGLNLRMTASFGVAAFPDDALNEEEMLRRADMAMYRVKGSTRDGVAGA
jgi:diguanylate cyclase (GGDEF)-like protein